MHRKVKNTVRKICARRSAGLREKILQTMEEVSEIVGCTLGPGGLSVLVERQEEGMPPFTTKDGVTVYRNLAFGDEIKDLIAEAARDASVRTASIAGDGTTTAVILAAAIVRQVFAFCDAHPEWSPQAVVRRIGAIFERDILGFLESKTIKIDLENGGRELLLAVARVSANGDEPLASAVLECFDIVGDEGHVIVTEKSGVSQYLVEQIPGYPLDAGHEQTCARFAEAFINDQGRSRIVLKQPNFILNFGRINSPNAFLPLINALMPQIEASAGKESDRRFGTNWVVVATGFSEETLAWMAGQFTNPASQMRFVPQVVPDGPSNGYQNQILRDLAAITGSTIFDSVQNPLPSAAAVKLHLATLAIGPCLDSYEATRQKALILGQGPEKALLKRIAEVKGQVDDATSDFDRRMNKLRLARLTGGVAKIVVSGGSNAEIRERKDRVDDAICAVRGAVKHGCLPGAGWTYLALSRLHDVAVEDEQLYREILSPALLAPTMRILTNTGIQEDKAKGMVVGMMLHPEGDERLVYDAARGAFVDAVTAGLLDSAQAVTEALRSALSIALQLGTLGAAIAFPRDAALERSEAEAEAEWARTVGSNEVENRL